MKKPEIEITYSTHIKQNGLWDSVDHRTETYVNGEYKPEIHNQDLLDAYVTDKEVRGHLVTVTEK